MKIKTLTRDGRTAQQNVSLVMALLSLSTVALTCNQPAMASEEVNNGAVSTQVLIEPTRQELLDNPALLMPLKASNLEDTKPLAKPLEGSVTVVEQKATPQQTLDHLVDLAELRDEQREELLDRARFHGKTASKVIARSRNMLQFATAYQGFASSSEAADVILGEKLKLKNSYAVEYVMQKKLDARHIQITCALIEIATGLGMIDPAKRDQTVQLGMKELVPLVGEEEANKTAATMTEWSKSATIPDEQLSRDGWDILSIKQKTSETLTSSLKNDSVVKAIETRLHKYNHRSDFMRVLAKCVNTTCTIVALSPTFASPAAQAAEFLFVASTGGPEEKKLLSEVYLDRCFASRFERLSQESMLTVTNMNNSVLTKNAVLYACTQTLMDGMTKTHSVTPTTATAASSDSEKAAAIDKSVSAPEAATANTPTTDASRATE